MAVAKFAFEFIARLIGADYRTDDGFGTQRLHVEQHIAGPAQPDFAPDNVHHRHRGFGRNALHAAPDVGIEHDIANNQDAEGVK